MSKSSTCGIQELTYAVVTHVAVVTHAVQSHLRCFSTSGLVYSKQQLSSGLKLITLHK